MKATIRIHEHTFHFISEREKIISYITHEYEKHIISHDDYLTVNSHNIDLDTLLKEKNCMYYESIINNIIVNTINSDGQYYLMHAGVVVLHNVAILLCGKTTSGKSTACFLLNDIFGLTCITDDIAFIDKSSLLVSCIHSTIKLRKEVVEKYELQKRISLKEHSSNGDNRYTVVTQNNAIVNLQIPIGIIIEIQYVNDDSLQSSTLLNGQESLLTVLTNSYSQNRLYDSYNTIVKIACSSVIKKIKYHNPTYLYDEIMSTMEGINNDG